MQPALAGLARMALSPLAALAVYLLLRPLSEVAGLAAGSALMLALALAGTPAARDAAESPADPVA